MSTPSKLRSIASLLTKLAAEMEGYGKKQPRHGFKKIREKIIAEYLEKQPETVNVYDAITDLRALGAFSRTTYVGDLVTGVARRITDSGRTPVMH